MEKYANFYEPRMHKLTPGQILSKEAEEQLFMTSPGPPWSRPEQASDALADPQTRPVVPAFQPSPLPYKLQKSTVLTDSVNGNLTKRGFLSRWRYRRTQKPLSELINPGSSSAIKLSQIFG